MPAGMRNQRGNLQLMILCDMSPRLLDRTLLQTPPSCLEGRLFLLGTSHHQILKMNTSSRDRREATAQEAALECQAMARETCIRQDLDQTIR